MIRDDSYKSDIARVIKNIPGIETLRQKKILITGCTGMLISPVADILFYLNEYESYGMKVILAARNREKTEKRFAGNDFTFLQYDATSSESINEEGVDFIIHGASNAAPASFASQPVETIMSNITGLKVLLDLARANKSRLLYISSSEVYGRKESSEPFPEDYYGFVDILNPRASYPNSKRLAETLCVAYASEYGIDPVMARPGHIYGPSIIPSDNRASAEFTRNAARGEDIIMKSSGSQLRSYCYTLDCASAVLCILINGKSCEAYNISNPDSVVSIRDIAQAFADKGNVSLRIQEATSSEKKSYNLMDNSSLRSDRLCSLGWKAEFSLEEGVARTLQYYEDN